MHTADAQLVQRYVRHECEGVPVYLNPALPDWFVPSLRGDSLLQLLAAGASRAEAAQVDSSAYGLSPLASLLLIDRFLSRLQGSPEKPYTGRSDKHGLDYLRELWIHITNRCTMSCRHCMFSSCPAEHAELSTDAARTAVREALALGCRLFYFTGGEPFLHRDLTGICDEALRNPAAHVMILTNGTALEQHAAWLKNADSERIHFQISLDGSPASHDRLRGAGAFTSVTDALSFLQNTGGNCTLAMSVCEENLDAMAAPVETACRYGVAAVHYLWFFAKGKGGNRRLPAPEKIVEGLLGAWRTAAANTLLIDNLEILKSQVFSLPGTRFDLSNAGWQSLAVGPDGTIYPSPALVGEAGMAAGHIREGLERVWRTSPVLEQVRTASLIDDEGWARNPLRFLIGGGDMDHSYLHGGTLTGHDPYVEVYNRLALHIIAEEARRPASSEALGLLSRMGEKLYACDAAMGENAFTHSNCVLSLPGSDGHRLVRAFYTAAAEAPNKEIFNPVSYAEDDIAHVPASSRVRSYGCGSPVMDCDLRPGATVVDLGCGAGVECFIAAKKVGPHGKVIGIDMADAMLALAEQARKKVAENLRYDIVRFEKAYLEQLAVASDTADIVISNCVINLSPDKRKTFSEIFRVLKPGGRLVISDIAYDEDIPLEIKYNERLRGECVGGAFKECELFALLEDLQFEEARLLKRFLYREISGYRFYAITYTARKPGRREKQSVLYRGPFAAVVTDRGQVLARGAKVAIETSADVSGNDAVFAFDANGQIMPPVQEETCSCCPPTEKTGAPPPQLKTLDPDHRGASCACCPADNTIEPAGRSLKKLTAGCMVCGSALVYFQNIRTMNCHYCGNAAGTPAACEQGHFVCDACHAADALSVISNVCLATPEKDMIALLKKVRSHRSFPVHGPEHHALVPGIILAAYRNTTGALTNSRILTGIERGATIEGGFCGFMGVCGVAIGVGVAFAVILEAHPLKAQQRHIVQKVTAEALQHIAEYRAPRCCQREAYIGLQEASRLSRRYLGVHLAADEPLACKQSARNQECFLEACPLWPGEVPCCTQD